MYFSCNQLVATLIFGFCHFSGFIQLSVRSYCISQISATKPGMKFSSELFSLDPADHISSKFKVLCITNHNISVDDLPCEKDSVL
jgi:hypothetical protein